MKKILYCCVVCVSLAIISASADVDDDDVPLLDLGQNRHVFIAPAILIKIKRGIAKTLRYSCFCRASCRSDSPPPYIPMTTFYGQPTDFQDQIKSFNTQFDILLRENNYSAIEALFSHVLELQKIAGRIEDVVLLAATVKRYSDIYRDAFLNISEPFFNEFNMLQHLERIKGIQEDRVASGCGNSLAANGFLLDLVAVMPKLDMKSPAIFDTTCQLLMSWANHHRNIAPITGARASLQCIFYFWPVNEWIEQAPYELVKILGAGNKQANDNTRPENECSLPTYSETDTYGPSVEPPPDYYQPDYTWLDAVFCSVTDVGLRASLQCVVNMVASNEESAQEAYLTTAASYACAHPLPYLLQMSTLLQHGCDTDALAAYQFYRLQQRTNKNAWNDWFRMSAELESGEFKETLRQLQQRFPQDGVYIADQ